MDQFFIIIKQYQNQIDMEQKKEVCSKEDLIVIVKEQVSLENELSLKANKILLLDTNIIPIKIELRTT